MTREEKIDLLVKEAVTGVTKRPTLPYSGGADLTGEAEAYYFQAVKNFFETYISHMVMTHKLDIDYGEVPKVKVKSK